jgi:hypothetical protein
LTRLEALNFCTIVTIGWSMMYSNLQRNLRKVCATGAALLLIAGASTFDGTGIAQPVSSTSAINRRPPVIPETNPGIVLLPFFLAAILLSSRHLLRQKAAQEG